MQFMDFPGRFVLSHQLPGALQKKVLAKDGLVLSLKGGFLPNLNWVFPGGGGGVLGHCMLAHKHLLGAPKRNPTLPAPHHQSPDSLSPGHCSPLHPALSYLTPGNSQRKGRAWPRLPLPEGGWPSFTKQLTAQLSLAALGVESKLGKAEPGREGGPGLQGLPSIKLGSHFPPIDCDPVRWGPTCAKL